MEDEDKFKEKAIIYANMEKLRPLLYEKDILMFKLENLIKRVDPLTQEQLIERYNAENEDSQMHIEYLTPEQIKEKYRIDYNTTETGY